MSVKFLLSWFLPFWIVIELIPTKLFHYPLPIIPPLVLLISGALIYFSKNKMNFENYFLKNLTFTLSCIFSIGGVILGVLFLYLILKYSENKNEILIYGFLLFCIFLTILYLSTLINANLIFNTKYKFVKKLDQNI